VDECTEIGTIAKLFADWGSCNTTEELLAQATSALKDLVGTGSVLAVRYDETGPRVLAGEGPRPETSELGSTAPPAGAFEAPPAWRAAGLEDCACVPVGDLVLLYADKAAPAVDSATATLAHGVLDAALARVHTAEELRDLEARVDNAQQLANMGDYDWHIASNKNRWSDHLYRIYGYEPQSFSLTYERLLDLIHPDDRERIQGIHQQAYATGEPYQMIERIVRPDGEVRYLSSNGQVIMDATGTPQRMRCTCVDITDQVLAEEAEERSAARFRALVESSPDAIVVFEADGTIIQANGHAADLLGADPTGRDLQTFLSQRESGLGVAATALDGRPLLLDVATVTAVGDGDLGATYLRDAGPRVAGEALAAQLRESQVRRRQALELNDTVVQGLTASILALQGGDDEMSSYYLGNTLIAARSMMNEWLAPLVGSDLEPGDLVRSEASALHAPPPAEEVAPEPAAHRILLVDDNEDVRKLLRLKLESTDGFEVVGEGADGEEAVTLVEQLTPDVVVLDLAMPKMDGLQALPLILPAVPGIKVIVLSGFDQAAMADLAFEAGAHAYLEKGLRMDLEGAIRTVLKDDPAARPAAPQD